MSKLYHIIFSSCRAKNKMISFHFHETFYFLYLKCSVFWRAWILFSTDLANHQKSVKSWKKEKCTQLVDVPMKSQNTGLWLYVSAHRNIKVQSLSKMNPLSQRKRKCLESCLKLLKKTFMLQIIWFKKEFHIQYFRRAPSYSIYYVIHKLPWLNAECDAFTWIYSHKT